MNHFLLRASHWLAWAALLCACLNHPNGLMAQNGNPLYVAHWARSSDPDLTAGSAGAASTATLDTLCSQVKIEVTDTANAPLPAFSAYIINPQDSSGAEITDLSGNLRIYVRAKSREPVRLAVLLRSGGGTSSERTNFVEFTVPGDTATWSSFVYEFDATNLGGFDSLDLRDVWVYLDRGDANFAGNECYLDYVAIGAAPDSATLSTCGTTQPPAEIEGPLYTLHWEGQDSVFTGSSAAALTQTIDSACSQLKVAVTDPGTNPLASFSPLILFPRDSNGNNLVDLSGNLSIHLRVRSKEAVSLGLLLRSGDGSAAFRTTLQEQSIPGDTLNWTEVTFLVDTSNLGGFDSTDLRDIWLFLDRGTDNFAGNAFYLDYLSLGEAPDSLDNSSCSFLPPVAFPYVVHWADTSDRVFSGSGAEQLTQVIDPDCSELAVSVADPVGDPLAAFRPLIVNPADPFGNEITDLSGQMRCYIRLRSAEELLVGMTLRAGDGTMPFRTEVVEKVVPADLTQWTELEFTFTGADYGGFDSTDLRDIWFYFDREVANFNGNELYVDYVSIGSKPDPALNSGCVQSVSLAQKPAIEGLTLYPNPSQAAAGAQLEFQAEGASAYQVAVFDMTGTKLWVAETGSSPGQQRLLIPSMNWAPGLYLVQVVGGGQKRAITWMIR
jgi:hypothetical protein